MRNPPLGIPGSQRARLEFVGSGLVAFRPRGEGRSSLDTGRRISLGRWGWRALPVVRFLPLQHVWETPKTLRPTTLADKSHDERDAGFLVVPSMG